MYYFILKVMKIGLEKLSGIGGKSLFNKININLINVCL